MSNEEYDKEEDFPHECPDCGGHKFDRVEHFMVECNLNDVLEEVLKLPHVRKKIEKYSGING